MKSASKHPLVTVITVVYNGFKDIEKTITSVTGQDYENLEYIIIDGCSTDGTIEKIKTLSTSKIVWISEPDKGIYDAMNKGIKMAKGKWINFMNCGDTFYNNKVLTDVFNSDIPNDTIVLYGDVILKYPSYNFHRNCSPRKNENMQIVHQCTFTRSDKLKEYEFDTNYKIAADSNFFNILINKKYKFFYIPICIAYYEAFYGLSSKRKIILFKENSIIKGTKTDFYKYYIGYSRIILSTLVQMIIPVNIYEKIRRRILIKNSRIKEII